MDNISACFAPTCRWQVPLSRVRLATVAIFVWGSCFCLCKPACPLPPPPAACPHRTYSHTTCPHTTYSHTTYSHTTCHHTTSSHTTCPHTTYSHTTFHHTTCHHTTCSHTTYSHTPCPHATCSHTTCHHTTCHHTTCPHTTDSHTTCPHTTCSHTTCPHTTYPHTQLTPTQPVTTQLPHTQLVHTQLTPVQLFTTQLFTNLSTHNLLTHNLSPHNLSTQTTCSHTTYSHTTCPQLVRTCSHTTYFGWQAWHLRHWAGSGAALGSQLTPWAPRLFAWQVATSTFTLRGSRGAWRHRLPLCVAGVAFTALGWLWWRAWVQVDAVGAAPLCVAGVALGDTDRHFAWQAWHLRHWAGSGCALGSQLTPWAPRLFAWQAWHLATWTVTLRASRGAWQHRPSLCVAGVALMALDWLWWHTQLFRTTLSQIPFTHNFVTQAFHTQLCHTQLFHTQLWSHTTFSHTTLLRTQTYTHTHNTFTQLFHPTCLAPSPFLPAFPISFSHLLVIIGRSWFVGLSGPLILHYFLSLPIFLIVSHSFFLFCCFFWVLLSSRHVWRFLLPAAFWPRVCRSGHALALEPLNLLAAYEHLSATYSDMFQPPLGSKRHKVSRYFRMFHGFKTFQQYQYPSTTSAKLVAQFCTVPHEMSGKYWKTTLCPIVFDCVQLCSNHRSRT